MPTENGLVSGATGDVLGRNFRATPNGAMNRNLQPQDCTWYKNLVDTAGDRQAVRDFKLIETHISMVVLTGKFAYKLKKPVCMPFLDFRKLEQRRHFLLEELRLNRRTAPNVYLGVVPVCGSHAAPVLDGDGAAFDYALKMRQFDQSNLFSSMLASGKLHAEQVCKLATVIADFHQRVDRALPSDEFASPARVRKDILDNFAVLEAHTPKGKRASARRADLENLRAWSEQWFTQHAELIAARRRRGAVRECHGDLHLNNIVWLDDTPTLFDCIEFSQSLRWIDVANEIAFLTMDLEAHGQPELANLFLNEYLQCSRDYQVLTLLTGFMVYRALVRAKVAMLSSEQVPEDREATAARYIDYCKSVVGSRPMPQIILTHGVSGSGKSWLARQVAAQLGAIALRADNERAHIPEYRRYNRESSDFVYRRLQELSEIAIASGFPVVVDATFLKRHYRAQFVALAKHLGVAVVALATVAPKSVLCSRIEQRTRAGNDPSEATVEVLEEQLRSAEPLVDSESLPSVVVDASTDVDVITVAADLLVVGRVSEVSNVSGTQELHRG